MKTLKKGETSRKETIINTSDKVADIESMIAAGALDSVCHHASAHPSLADDERFQLEWGFDFADCPLSQIVRAATEYCLIAKRREFVKVKAPKASAWNGVLFSAKDLIPTPKSKGDKLLKDMKAFSGEELAKILKEAGIEVADK